MWILFESLCHVRQTRQWGRIGTRVKLVRRYLARVILEALDGQLVAAILDQLNLYLNRSR